MADALARDGGFLSHFIKRVFGVHANAETACACVNANRGGARGRAEPRVTERLRACAPVPDSLATIRDGGR